MFTDINSEDRLVQKTFADYLQERHQWESVYAWNDETFGPEGTLGRTSEREVVLVRYLRQAITRLNPELPASAVDEAVAAVTAVDFSRSTIQHNREAYRNIRRGFDDNLTDYKDTIPHAFYQNAFLVVSNGDHARYGSITSKWEHFGEWKRNSEADCGSLEARVMLDGMLAKERLLDLVENFVLFDDSKPGGTRKIVARNHQVLGVNRAVEAVRVQEVLKQQFPAEQRVRYRVARVERPEPEPIHEAYATAESEHSVAAELPAGDAGREGAAKPDVRTIELPLVERAHPDLGRLGVFWHTQGSGKSYSMAFFTEKVRRVVPGNFTFVIMTDRDDLDDQIYRTFFGCGVTDQKTPRATSGTRLREILKGNHRYVFTLIHKFNLDVPPGQPYSKRDNIIVLSDEAHRTQAGKLARNMRLALPNASFIGFTGTPLLKHDQLTQRIFGSYVSRYDFRRSEQDGATVKLVYENRGEKLGVTRLDLNDRIAEKIEEAGLNADQQSLLQKLLGKDYEVITADDRLDKIADDFVEHCSARWECGKSMLVCIDKVTCGRMHQRILPRWQNRAAALRAEAGAVGAQLAAAADSSERDYTKSSTKPSGLRALATTTPRD